MELSSSDNYNHFSKINYLNIKDGNYSGFKTNLSNLLNNDSSLNAIIDDVSYSNALNSYVINRDTLDINDPNVVDQSLFQATLSKNLLANELMEKNNQTLKMIYNRRKQLENEEKYNNIIIQSLDISDESAGYGLGEIPTINNDISMMEIDIEEKERNLQVNKYYEKKMKHQLSILKRLVFFLLILFLIGYIYKLGLINETTFVVLIGGGLALIVLYAFYSVIDILMRDNINYDEYKFLFHSDMYLNKGEKMNTENKIGKFGIEYDLLPDSCKSPEDAS
jgi:hypothetical protein